MTANIFSYRTLYLGGNILSVIFFHCWNSEEKRRNQSVDNPERELFFWALLFGRKELAMLFWRLGRDHIGGALTASRLWKSLAVAADREEELDLGQELEDSSR
jgi:hypothetical protein